MSEPLAPILGHQDVIRRLWRAIERDSLHHAYLFEGPAGVGKRTVALRLAMAANCEGEGPPPCGVCRACHTIAAGTHPDVFTLEPDPDRATPIIPVDAVREVVRKTGYHRFSARRRFVIVDPAEAMQPAAANALLKTLEEPPPGTGFVLIASNSTVLLPTIISRCQRLRFGAVPEAEVTRWLVERDVDPDIASRAAAQSQGCPGRALELVGGALEDRIALRDEVLGVLRGSLSKLYDFSKKQTRGKRQTWRPRVDDVFEVLEDLLRDAVITGSGAELPLINADRPEVVGYFADRLYPDGVISCERALQEARRDLEVNVSGKTLLDALLLVVRRELRLG